MAAMDEVTTVRIKQEEVEDMPNDPVSMFLEDPLGVYWSTDYINEDSKLNFGWDENENNNAVVNTLLHIILEAESECCPPPLLVAEKELFPDDTFGISCQTDFIKEDPELNLEADETQNIMPNTSVVDHMEIGWIKNDDETNEVCSMVPSSVTVKEELQENLNQEALKAPLHIGESSFHVKQEREFKHDVDGSKPNALKAPLHIGESSFHVKQEREFKHDVDGSKPNALKAPLHIGESSFHVKQEREFKHDVDGSKPNALKDPLHIGESSFHVKQEHEFKYDVNGYKPNALKDPLHIGDSSFHVKQEHEFKHDVDDSEPSVATTRSSESYGTRLIRHSRESCYISSEEIVKQEVAPGELEIGAGESISSTVFGIHTQQTEEKEDSLFGIRLKCNLREKECRKLSCSFCLRNFPSKYRLIMHVFIHIDGVEPPTYICKSCGEVFCTNISLRRHVKMNGGVQAPFDGHNYKFGYIYNNENIVEGDQEIAFMEDTENHSSNKKTTRILRKFCNDNYKTQIMTSDTEKQNIHKNYRSLSVSGNVKHHTVAHIYKCDVCGKAFTQLKHLKTHGLIHTDIRSHTCNICGKYFPLLGNLKMHSLIHIGLKQHKCDICGRCFTQLSSLKGHLLIHAGSTPHTCNICGKSFTRCDGLKQHSLIHTGEKPHKCGICGKTFLRLGDLNQHSLIHTGSNPHKCDVCGKSFLRLHTLKQHSLIDTGSKPHKCDICGKSFNLMCNLRKHSLIHTGVKPHKCNICGKFFTRLGHVKRHLAIHNRETS